MTDFYLTLPSNTNIVDNKTCKFSVRLPRTIYLRGKWEVALVEIQYPYSWNNLFGLRNGELADNWIDITFDNDFIFTLFVPPGFYGTVGELLGAVEYAKEKASESLDASLKEKYEYLLLNPTDDEIDPAVLVVSPHENKTEIVFGPRKFEIQAEHIKDIRNGFFFEFDDTLKRVKCKRLPQKIKHIELSQRLQYMFGFEKPDIFNDKETARFCPDLRGGFYSLHVYCDVVEPQIIGDTLAPLLRCVHVKGIHGDIVEKVFDSPHYVPVLPNDIDRIDIEIKDDTNQFVPFDFGKVVAKLHFRKKRLLI